MIHLDRRLVAALLTLALTGCSGAPAPAAEPASAPAPAAQATPEPAQPAVPAAPAVGPGEAPTPKAPDAAATSQIEAAARGQLSGDVRNVQAFPLKQGRVPAGYDQLIVVTGPDNRVSLVSVDKAKSKAKVLSTVTDVLWNAVKVWVSDNDKGQVVVLSQQPFRATERSVTLAWDGRMLQVVSDVSADPTAAYYRKREPLLAAGDLEGLMKLAEQPLYPHFYDGFHTQPGPILKLAHQRALQKYQTGDLETALRYMEYGILEYEVSFGDLVEPNASNLYPEWQLPVADRIELQNDYALFLAEAGRAKEAEPLLLQVIKAAPDRTVAHLNLADVEWDLGKQPQAREHYQKYLDLLGPNRGQAPARVLERLN
ncbi:MAG TPA: tetratricopeptide repeat protein [Symbiobacteriaceae bacterium]|nr:tetratricopeptide repeat protein [Symbiobacteriaceae bacterium]